MSLFGGDCTFLLDADSDTRIKSVSVNGVVYVWNTMSLCKPGDTISLETDIPVYWDVDLLNDMCVRLEQSNVVVFTVPPFSSGDAKLKLFVGADGNMDVDKMTLVMDLPNSTGWVRKIKPSL